MLLLVMMGMMVMVAGIAANSVAAGSSDGTTAADIVDSARFATAASGLRCLGVAP